MGVFAVGVVGTHLDQLVVTVSKQLLLVYQSMGAYPALSPQVKHLRPSRRLSLVNVIGTNHLRIRVQLLELSFEQKGKFFTGFYYLEALSRDGKEEDFGYALVVRFKTYKPVADVSVDV